MRRRTRRRGCGNASATVIVAFGAGLLLALLCSVRFALLIAAILLIYLGITWRSL